MIKNGSNTVCTCPSIVIVVSIINEIKYTWEAYFFPLVNIISLKCKSRVQSVYRAVSIRVKMSYNARKFLFFPPKRNPKAFISSGNTLHERIKTFNMHTRFANFSFSNIPDKLPWINKLENNQRREVSN